MQHGSSSSAYSKMRIDIYRQAESCAYSMAYFTKSSAVMSLWWIDGYPPQGQLMACSTVNCTPKRQWEGMKGFMYNVAFTIIHI